MVEENFEPSAGPLYKQLKVLKFGNIFRLSIVKFVYLTLCEESPSVFSEWFTYNHSLHSLHSHATKSGTTLSQTDFFDVGTEHPTYTLYAKNYNLNNYGKK